MIIYMNSIPVFCHLLFISNGDVLVEEQAVNNKPVCAYVRACM